MVSVPDSMPPGPPARRGPAPPWEDLLRRPPDVLALCNLVLDHTEFASVLADEPGSAVLTLSSLGTART